MGGIALLVVGSTLFHLAGSGWQGPVVDAWRFLPVVRAYHSGEAWLSRLLAPHGAHVLFFPRLLHLVDYAFFSGRNVFLAVCGVLLQTLNALALIAVVYRSPRLTGSEKTFAGALCLALLFSATQLENFARGWNVHWFLALFGVLAAALSLVRGAETAAAPGRSGAAWGWLLCSLASASLASLSMANGLLAWPLGIALAVRTRAPASWSLLYAATGFLFGMAYWGSGAASAATLDGSLDGSLGASLGESAPWAGLAGWMALCLGAPLSWTSPNAGMLLGSAGAPRPRLGDLARAAAGDREPLGLRRPAPGSASRGARGRAVGVARPRGEPGHRRGNPVSPSLPALPARGPASRPGSGGPQRPLPARARSGDVRGTRRHLPAQ